jgi:hypothetical protein
MDKEYTAGEAKAWLNGYDEGKKIRTSERSIQTSDTKPAESARAWVGLTDDERYLNDGRTEEEIEYAKAIEAKLKEKNGI